MSANLANTDPYWQKRKRELDAFTFFRRHIKGDLPCYFHTNSMAELHWLPLKQFLSNYLTEIAGGEASIWLQKLNEDKHFLRKTVLENLHIVTLYFEARSINYYNTVCKNIFQANDYWFRFEFAKARGQIHSHGIIFSETHAKNVENALNINGSSSDHEKAKNLYDWLQTNNKNTEKKFSPGFVSMHPAGGNIEKMIMGVILGYLIRIIGQNLRERNYHLTLIL